VGGNNKPQSSSSLILVEDDGDYTTSNNNNEGGGGSRSASNTQRGGGSSNAPRKKTRNHYEHMEPTSLPDLAISISQSILNTKPSLVVDGSLNLNTILSGVAYREILENLFGGGGGGDGNNAATDFAECVGEGGSSRVIVAQSMSAMMMHHPPPDIPVVSKAYEEAYMRECIGSQERPCVMGLECEGQFIDRAHRFTCTEFLLPGEARTEPQMCVMCCRKHTQKLFYDILYSPPSVHMMGVIQRYGVVVGAANEYAPEAALVIPANGPVHVMPFPSIAHCRANYTVCVRNATRFITQSKAVMDFQPPSHDEDHGSAA
jgi:hypothetical protein